MSAAASAVAPDTARPFGRFTLQRLLGEGAHATVWLGFDQRLEREVAVKRMRSDAAADPVAVGEWLREARSVSRLTHPNIVPVFEADVFEAQPYLVFEYVPGPTLAQLIKARGALPAHEAAGLTLGILDALHEAHNAGVVHRDLKPSNVLVGPGGRARVMDFGIAARLHDPNGADLIVGMPGNMSPEATRGAGPTATMDLFSVGLMLAEMLSGRRLVAERDPYRAMQRVADDDLALPEGLAAEVNDALRAVLRRSLERDPALRWQSAAAFPRSAADLADARPGRRPEAGRRHGRRRHARLPAAPDAAQERLPGDVGRRRADPAAHRLRQAEPQCARRRDPEGRRPHQQAAAPRQQRQVRQRRRRHHDRVAGDRPGRTRRRAQPGDEPGDARAHARQGACRAAARGVPARPARCHARERARRRDRRRRRGVRRGDVPSPRPLLAEFYLPEEARQVRGIVAAQPGAASVVEANASMQVLGLTVSPGDGVASRRAQFLADGSVGWAISDAGTIQRSVDKGRSWQALATPPSAPMFGVSDFHFADALQGWAVTPLGGSDGSIFGTVDGGVSWQPFASTKSVSGMVSVRFADGQHGMAVGPAGIALVSADGGATWLPRSTGVASNLRRLAVVDASTAVAVGEGGAIVRSTDRGRTGIRCQPTARTLNDVRFISSRLGHAVGEGGVQLATRDGGLTWTVVPTRMQTSLQAVFFVDEQTGWMAGRNGSILATATGGL